MSYRTMKVISLSPNSVQVGYSRSARGFLSSTHSGTQAEIQYLPSEVSANATEVASGKGERAKPRDFLLNQQKLLIFLPPQSIGPNLVTQPYMFIYLS